METPDTILHVTKHEAEFDELTYLAQNKKKWLDNNLFIRLDRNFMAARFSSKCYSEFNYFTKAQWLVKIEELNEEPLDWDAAPAKARAWHIPSGDFLYVRHGLLLESSTKTIFEQSYVDEHPDEFIFRPVKVELVADDPQEWQVYHGMEWAECIRLGVDIYNNLVYQITSGEFRGELNADPDEDSFRLTPIKLPAQLAEEEREKEITAMDAILAAAIEGDQTMAESLYNAGYRKVRGEGNE